MTLILDREGVVRHADASFAVLVGRTLEDLLGANAGFVLRPDPTVRAADPSSGAGTGGPDDAVRSHAIRFDGSLVPVIVRARHVPIDGRPVFVVTVERAEAAATDPVPRSPLPAMAPALPIGGESARALRDTERRFRSTFDQAAVGFAHVGLDGSFLRVNDRLCALLGYTRKELLRLRFGDLTLDTERDVDAAAASELIVGVRDVYTRDKRYIRKGGEVVWLHLTSTCVRDDRGRVEYFFSVLQDVSDRKRAEEARESAVSLLRATLDATVDGVVATDLDERFVSCNAAFLRMWNVEVGSDDAPARILHAPTIVDALQYRDAYVASLDDLYAHPEVDGFDVLEFSDGRVVERHSRPQRVGDRTVGRVFSFRDVTDRVRAELGRKRMREQTVEAHTMEPIGRLAGAIAHDFNNLLTVISSYSEMILRRRLVGERADEAMNEILRASDRAASLTSQLLAFGRKQVLDPRPVALNEALEGARGAFSRLLGSNIVIELQLDPRSPVVLADPTQLDQVVMNLVVNARDAMPEGGKLTCSTAFKRVDASRALDLDDIEPGLYGVLTIRDTGCGMSHETLSRVYEPFFTTKESGRGTGLGLATVFGIVRQSGGAIAIESRLGAGTLVNVYFPASDALPGKTTSERPGLARSGNETILVVEDSDAVRRLTRSVLESYGYTVLEAADGTAGLNAFANRTRPIHAVVTDVVMPHMSGRQLVAAIRSRDPRMPVLLLSGYNEAIAATESDRLGDYPFLAKPFTPEELAHWVRIVLDAKL